MFLHVLEVLESTLGESLDEDYKTPKTPRNYKGGTDVFPIKFRMAASSHGSTVPINFSQGSTPKKLSVAESIMANERRGLSSLRASNPINTVSNNSSSNLKALPDQEKDELQQEKLEKARRLQLDEEKRLARERERADELREQTVKEDALERSRKEKEEADAILETQRQEEARKVKEANREAAAAETKRQLEDKKRKEELERAEKVRKETEAMKAAAIEQAEKSRREVEAAALVAESLKRQKDAQETAAKAAELAAELARNERREREAAEAATAAAELRRQSEQQRTIDEQRTPSVDATSARNSVEKNAEKISGRNSTVSVDSDDVRASEVNKRGSLAAASAAADEGLDSDNEMDPADTIVDDVIMIQPVPGVVIKTKTKKTGVKFFINVCHHELISPMTLSSASSSPSSSMTSTPTLDNLLVVVGDIREINDKSGESCMLVDCAINSKRFFAYFEDAVTNARDKLCVKILKSLGKQMNESLDEDYKTPKTKGNYKQPSESSSGIIPMDITAAVGSAAASSHRRSVVDGIMNTGRNSIGNNSGLGRSNSSGVGGIISSFTNRLSSSLATGPAIEVLPGLFVTSFIFLSITEMEYISECSGVRAPRGTDQVVFVVGPR
jgi:myosin heavy subunit